MEKTGLDFAYAAGCDWKLKSDDVSGFEEAVAVARRADVVVMCVGEHQDYSGESKSRGDICIPPVQKKLIE